MKFKTYSWVSILSICFLLVGFGASAKDIEVAGTLVAEGSRENISIPVGTGGGNSTEPETFIPVTVINGGKSGPVLATIAGVHGYEYNSILATEKWLANIDPSTIAGTIIAVRVAHIPAFEEKSIYVNPYDRKNLNRSFPGKVEGTQTEQIAWNLSNHVIAKADFVIDLHSGDGAEWLAGFVGVYGGPLSSNYAQAMLVAEGFQFPNIVTYKMKTQKQVDTRRSLNRQAVAHGAPTILVEIGENGSKKEEHINAMVTGLEEATRILGITSPSSINTSKADLASQGAPDRRYFEGTFSVPVNFSGLWFPEITTGQFLKKGDMLGVVKDYFGNTVETVIAPESGFALYGLSGPSVKQGQSIMTIAKQVK
ncbi:M14 family metallopeptidase [Alteromonas lipotrueae]|uniref:M14 family metallopeptidase n=1 Tax=Alteromonas lipotrueae TaxID=2803814 RepID=UPI001C43B659|nr:M14 family metallopeptidase [Alteromonas lipotrueae]